MAEAKATPRSRALDDFSAVWLDHVYIVIVPLYHFPLYDFLYMNWRNVVGFCH